MKVSKQEIEKHLALYAGTLYANNSLEFTDVRQFINHDIPKMAEGFINEHDPKYLDEQGYLICMEHYALREMSDNDND